MKDNFTAAITKTLSHEGGWVNDPDDPGGATKYGISKAAYPDLDIAALTIEQARQIYRCDYWVKPGLDLVMDKALACKLFDLAVNTGPGRAVKFVQQACNTLGAGLKIDGILGAQTLAWINACRHPAALLMAVKVFAGQYYMALDKPKFLAGWLKRLAA